MMMSTLHSLMNEYLGLLRFIFSALRHPGDALLLVPEKKFPARHVFMFFLLWGVFWGPLHLGLLWNLWPWNYPYGILILIGYTIYSPTFWIFFALFFYAVARYRKQDNVSFHVFEYLALPVWFLWAIAPLIDGVHALGVPFWRYGIVSSFGTHASIVILYPIFFAYIYFQLKNLLQISECWKHKIFLMSSLFVMLKVGDALHQKSMKFGLDQNLSLGWIIFFNILPVAIAAFVAWWYIEEIYSLKRSIFSGAGFLFFTLTMVFVISQVPFLKNGLPFFSSRLHDSEITIQGDFGAGSSAPCCSTTWTSPDYLSGTNSKTHAGATNIVETATHNFIDVLDFDFNPSLVTITSVTCKINVSAVTAASGSYPILFCSINGSTATGQYISTTGVKSFTNTAWNTLGYTQLDNDITLSIQVNCSADGYNNCVSHDSLSYTDVTVVVVYNQTQVKQASYRLRANHQGETGTTWLAAADTPISSLETASTTRLRILENNTGDYSTSTIYQLEYATSTIAGYTGCANLSSWVPVANQASTTSYAWKMSPTSRFAGGGASTDNAGISNPAGTFAAGYTQDSTNRTAVSTLATARFTEHEWAIEANSLSYTSGQTYCFRSTNADSTTNLVFTRYPKISVATSSNHTLLHTRWRANHQGETGTTWLTGEDARLTSQATASTTRLRILLDETANGVATTTKFQLQYATSSIAGFTSCGALTDWVAVKDSASSTSFAWVISPSANIANGGATTNNAGLTDPVSGTFFGGQLQDISNRGSPLSLTADNFTELEWAIEATQEAGGDSYCFRVTNADTPTRLTFTQYPRISMSTTTSFIQEDFRLYENENSLNPSTAWASLAENTSMTTNIGTRLRQGDIIRIRMNLKIGGDGLWYNDHAFKLQYGNLSGANCSDVTTWFDILPKGGNGLFVFADNAFAESQTLVTPLISTSNTLAFYTESISQTNPSTAAKDDKLEFDWPLQYKGQISDTTICLRMVKSDGTLLDSYTRYPQILTAILGSSGSGGIGGTVGGDVSAGTNQSGGGSSGGTAVDYTATEGFSAPTANGTELTTPGNKNQWSNPANAYSTDNTYASETTNGEEQDYGNFGLSIPGSNTINGIEINVEARDTGLGNLDVALSYDGGTTYTSIKNSGALTGSDAVYTYGGSTDTWGRTWSPSEFSDTNFRVRLTAHPTTQIDVDHIQIKIHHAATGGGGGGGGEVRLPQKRHFALVSRSLDEIVPVPYRLIVLL